MRSYLRVAEPPLQAFFQLILQRYIADTPTVVLQQKPSSQRSILFTTHTTLRNQNVHIIGKGTVNFLFSFQFRCKVTLR